MAIFLKIMFFGILTVYLVGLGFLLPEMNKILNPDNQINYNSIDKTIPQSDGQKVTLISTIGDLPLWFNTIFVILPFILWIISVIIIFLPV